MKSIPVLLAACLLAACASGPVVQTDHDPAADFSGYRAYAWRQPPPIANPLLKQRVVAAIDAELLGRGWQQVLEPDADVVLVGNVSAHEEQTLDAFYDGPGWDDWSWRGSGKAGDGLRQVHLHNYKVGTLVLDMFDVDTKRAVWRATAEGTVPDSPAQIDRDAMAAVRGMFRDFPPKASAGEGVDVLQDVAPEAAPAVQVVDAFSKAIAAGELEAAKALLDPALVVLESGGVERSRDEYMGGHAAADAAFLKDARQSLRYRRASAQGGLAWVLSESRTERVVDGKRVRYGNTETMVLRETAGAWRIVHIHWSSRAIRD